MAVTLQSVAERMREMVAFGKGVDETRTLILREFESDPEFTAPERLKEAERQLAEALAENESAQAAWETRYSILVAALVSIAGSDTIGVHSEYIRMKAEARRVLEVKP